MASENQPLLSDRPLAIPLVSRSLGRSSNRILLSICIIKFSMTLATSMVMLPMLRLLEDAVCHQVREDTSRGLLDETLCKTEEVQARLGYLVGWQQVAEGVVSIVAAMPYGILADRVGRKPALLSSWCGMILGFAYIMGFIYLARDRNLYFVLVGSLFQIFGGGLSVAFSTIYAVASDVTASQNRATSFFYLAISATLGGISGPPLAGKIMMLYGPWAPIFVVLALSPPIIVLILLLPETLPQPALPPQKQALSSSISRSISALSTSFHELLPSLQLLCSRNIQLVMAVFFLQTPIYTAYSTIMVQYVSHHFGWTIARTSYLFIPLGLLNILCLASLPRLSRELRTRLRLSAWRKDVALTRVALGLVAAGALIEWASRNVEWFMAGLVVGTLGSSNNPLARAVATRYVPREDTSRLMALIGIVETVGSFFGGPVLALCFEIGLRKKGWLTGLPYLYIAGLCGATLVGLGFLHRPVGGEEECEDEGP